MAAAGTAEFWKHWEGRVVDTAFPLQKYLGGSARGAVFLTEHAGEKDRRAVIRLVRANLSGAEQQLARWQRASKLSHPNLIRLLSWGRCQLDETAMLYVVMEHAEEDLSQVIPDRPLTAAETRDMLGPVLRALAYLHGQGFVQGHLKPANIMAIGDCVKISSDGLWRAGETAEQRATPGPYDPPESVTGGISPAGDVWSLGVTLVEAATQRLPSWRGAGQHELALPGTLQDPFLDIARHCLTSNPESRWTVSQISARLKPAASAAVPKLAPKYAPRQDPATGGSARSKAWRYLVPLAALGLAAVGYAVFRQSSGTDRDADKARVTPAPVVQTSAVQTPPTQAPVVKTPVAQPEPAATPQDVSKPVKSSRAAHPAPEDVIEQVMPDIPSHAKGTLHGTFMVDVRVHVDASGAVKDASLDLAGPSKYFAERTLAAARKWRFRPTDAPQEWVLRFEFSKSEFRVSPGRVSP